MRGGGGPMAGGYDPNPKGDGRNPRQWVVHPHQDLRVTARSRAL